MGTMLEQGSAAAAEVAWGPAAVTCQEPGTGPDAELREEKEDAG